MWVRSDIAAVIAAVGIHALIAVGLVRMSAHVPSLSAAATAATPPPRADRRAAMAPEKEWTTTATPPIARPQQERAAAPVSLIVRPRKRAPVARRRSATQVTIARPAPKDPMPPTARPVFELDLDSTTTADPPRPVFDLPAH